ncbi:MAG: M42 family metallopeptidase [Ahrensia sp.]|nr:M42 family metallopeptidase [Ahrensia sp.]
MSDGHAIADDLRALMLIPGLCGHEDRVRKAIAERLYAIGLETRTDRLGNLITTIKGDDAAPSVMLFTHMDQLGFVVRKIEPDGFVRVERVGGVPERALASQAVLFKIGEGRDLPGVIANKSHHATLPDEKYSVVPYREIYVDGGFASAEEVRAAGIDIGTPIAYRPQCIDLANGRIAGPAIDDRAGCAVLLEIARQLTAHETLPTIHLVFSVQEEFNLRGAVVAAQALKPDIAIQVDLLLTGDTPDMADQTDVRLGGGPGISLYSFHGRGTLNGTIPHPALPVLFERAASKSNLPLQRSAQTGVLTETSYVQLVGEGVACIDVGFPCRYTHSSLEVCDLRDLEALADMLTAALSMIDAGFSLDRDEVTP